MQEPFTEKLAPAGARRADDRGASFVEYSLVFALLVVVTLGAVQYLTTSATAETDNQATCISRRPPPPECQMQPAIVPTTTVPVSTSAPPTTADPGPTTTLAPTTTTLPPPPSLVSGFALAKVSSPRPGVQVTVSLTSGSDLVAGGRVQLRMTAIAPGGSFETTVSCTTDDTGSCPGVEFLAPYSDTTRIDVLVVSVQADPPAPGPFPAAQAVTFP
jgi:Flp pilus assembly pilin Flp